MTLYACWCEKNGKNPQANPADAGMPGNVTPYWGDCGHDEQGKLIMAVKWAGFGIGETPEDAIEHSGIVAASKDYRTVDTDPTNFDRLPRKHTDKMLRCTAVPFGSGDSKAWTVFAEAKYLNREGTEDKAYLCQVMPEEWLTFIEEGE